MSLKSAIHDIDLHAKCDLARYETDIHPFEGFCETNSLFRNKRVMNWRKRSIGPDEIIGNMTWTKEGGNFHITNGNETHVISATGYEKTEVDSIPSDATMCGELGGTNLVLYDGASHGVWTSGNVKWISGGFVVVHDSTRIKVYRNGVFRGSINVGAKYARYTLLASHVSSETDVLMDSSDTDFKTELTIPADTVVVALINKNASGFEPSDIPYNVMCYMWNDTSFSWLYTASRTQQSCNLGIYNKSGESNLAIPEQQNFIFNQDFVSEEKGPIESVWSLILPSGEDNVNIGVIHSSPVSGTGIQASSWLYECIDTGSSTPSIKSKTYSPSFPVKASEKKDSEKLYTLTFELSVDGLNSIRRDYRINNVKDISGAGLGSYSMRYGKFAINYIRGVPENIGHEYKKIVSLDRLDGSVWHTASAMYWKETDGKFYSLALKEFDRPQFQIVGIYYLVFNTETYRNAVFNANGNFTPFCSCDDWNNRVFFTTEEKTGLLMETPVASRAGNDWSVSGEIRTVSSQYGSEVKIVPTVANQIKTWFVDPSYTVPADTSYPVYWSTDSGSQSGVMVQQGTISSSGFTIKNDEGAIWTDPADADGYQDNPPLLETDYMQFTNKLYVTIDGFIYQLQNFATLDSMPFLVFIAQETGFNRASFTQFCINGQVYTYYPGTSQILDSNDQWVCNIDCMEYVGFSTYAAYFYCTFDRNLYAFTGSNTMEVLAPIERVELQHSQYMDRKGGTVFMSETINVPSLNLVCFNFGQKLGVLMGEQFCLVDMGQDIQSMMMDREGNCIRVDGTAILLNDGADADLIPIELESEFYGNPGNSNSIFDTVYVSLSNLNGVHRGKLTIETEVLQNEKPVKSPAKEFTLSDSDFNSYGVAVVKFQPRVQEGRAIRIRLSTDFELSAMRVGESMASTESQTTIRG